MKRDARIGLAVVLVLGLAITLLVARSLHQRAAEVDERCAAAEQPKPAQFENVAEAAGATASSADASAEARAQDQAVMEFRTDHGATAAQRPAGPGQAASAQPRGETLDVPAYVAPAAAQVSQPGAQPASGASRPGVLPPVGEPPIAASATPQATAPAATGNALGFYAIAAGDNPWKISFKVFGDGKFAQKIVDANPGLNPNRMAIGQKIRIPALPGLTAKIPLADSTTASTPAAAAPATAADLLATAAAPGPVPAASNALAPVTSGAKTCVVQAGDTLSQIAKEHLGSAGPKAVKKILDANPGLDPARLKVGATIKIP
jgi:nucleoid-associated protein YgaU